MEPESHTIDTAGHGTHLEKKNIINVSIVGLSNGQNMRWELIFKENTVNDYGSFMHVPMLNFTITLIVS